MNDANHDLPIDDSTVSDAPSAGGPARDRIPIDTVREPHEPALRAESTIGMWLVVLSGPALWISHFFVVYLAAEASCAAERTPRMSFIGSDGVTAFVVAATVVALLLAVAGGFIARARASRPDTSDMYRVGVLLSWLSSLAILLVGVPVMALPVCG
jgi:hypothetical protein